MKTILRVLIFVMISTTFSSCFIGKAIETGKAKNEFTAENEAIPPDFGKDKQAVILGIIQNRRSYDKYLESAFKKNYTGPYKLITAEELVSGDYDDKEKYRYVLDYQGGTTQTTIRDGGLTSSIQYKRYFVHDRFENKSYMSGAEFTFFAKALKVYVENLDIHRKSQI